MGMLSILLRAQHPPAGMLGTIPWTRTGSPSAPPPASPPRARLRTELNTHPVISRFRLAV